MSAIAEMIDGVKRIDALLADADLEPRAERDDWPTMKGRVEALRDALARDIDPKLGAALEEAEGSELTAMIQRRTAHLYADAAAVFHASGDGIHASALLARAARTTPDEAHRAELAAAAREPAVFTRLVLARWLLHDGRFGDADREAKRVRRETKERVLSDGAKKVLRSPRPLTGGAPSLFTINGVGAGLYGSRDRDAEGTYVATYCICFLFIPVFPLAAYRVMRAGPNGYRFFAKEPLSTFARGVQIAFGLGVAALVGGLALNAHLTSPEHRSEVALGEARAAEAAGKADDAMTAYRGVLEQFPVTLPAAKEAAAGVARLAAREVPSPCTAASVEPARRAANAYLAVAETRRGTVQPGELLDRLTACATEIGDGDTEAARASLRVLDLAGDVAKGGDRFASVQERRAAARRAFASKVAEARPLLALAELVKLDDAESVAAAKAIIFGLGAGPSLWVEAAPDIERWSRGARAVPGMDADAAAARLAKAREQHREAKALIDAGDAKAIEKAAAAQPDDQELHVAVAAQMRARGDVKAAAAHLANLGPPGRLTAEAQEALANAYADTGDLPRADAILSALLDERLPAFQDAQRAYFTAADALQERLLADLRSGSLPPDLRRRVDAVFDEGMKREEVQKWLSARVESDPSLQGVRSEYVQRGSIVSAALSLGMVKLRRAADARGDERKALLSDAERAFLAIRSEAAGDPSFHLALGQVYHRLGKTEEGEKEIQSVLDAGDPVLSLAVARTYRELGLAARARKVARDVYDKASEDDARHRAADLLAHMAVDLEEEETWLRRADPDDPTVRIGLVRVEAERLLRDGQNAEADRKFALCAEHFARDAKADPVAANNAATERMRRYAATGDPAHLDAAVQQLEASLRLAPDNALVMNNLASALAYASYVRVLGRWVDMRALALDPDACRSLVGSMIDGPLAPEVLDALRGDASFRRALEVSGKLQVLAPQMGGAYRLHLLWYGWTADVKALEDLQKRVELLPTTDTNADLREQWQSGERDEAQAKEVRAEVAMARRRVEQVKAASKPTRAAAWAALSDALLSAAFFERDAATLGEAAEATRSARAAWPEGVTGREAARTLFALAFLGSLDASPALKKAWDEGRREHSSLVLAHLAAQADGGAAEVLRRSPAFGEALALVKESVATRPTVSDFLMARLAADAELEKAASRAFERREVELDYAIDAKLDPGDESSRVNLSLFRSRGASTGEPPSK